MQRHTLTGALLASGIMALTIGCAQRPPTTTVEGPSGSGNMYMPERDASAAAATPAPAKPKQPKWMATDFNSINGNLTPELRSTAQRPVDTRRAIGYMSNANFRMFWDDLGRAFYTDHPSTLSPYPIVLSSGTPR